MMRHEVNQALLDRYAAPAYLEIGVDAGETFHALRAARKVGVDPHYRFDLEAAKADPTNVSCVYRNKTSDAYFAEDVSAGEKFDLVFIDGLHTFDQTLKDLLNTLSCIREDSVVVVDDVIPSSYAASLPDLDLTRRFWAATNNPDGSWMGDVFRLTFFIRDYLPFFEYATVQENHGQMILWRGRRSAAAPLSVEAISRLEYPIVPLNMEAFKVKPFQEILSLLPPVERP